VGKHGIAIAVLFISIGLPGFVSLPRPSDMPIAKPF
jgi:hypothetical protein